MQERYIGRRCFHVHEKVGTREAEQNRKLVGVEQQRVEVKLTLAVAQNRHRERIGAIAVGEPPDDVSALVAEKQRTQYLDLTVRIEAKRPRQIGARREDDAPDVAFDI